MARIWTNIVASTCPKVAQTLPRQPSQLCQTSGKLGRFWPNLGGFGAALSFVGHYPSQSLVKTPTRPTIGRNMARLGQIWAGPRLLGQLLSNFVAALATPKQSTEDRAAAARAKQHEHANGFREGSGGLTKASRSSWPSMHRPGAIAGPPNVIESRATSAELGVKSVQILSTLVALERQLPNFG